MKKKLNEEILRLSNSKDFNDAKAIWIVDCAYQPKTLSTCLCGKTNVTDLVRFRKMRSTEMINVCSVCANELSGLNFQNVFEDIKKLKQKSSSKVGKDTLDYLIDAKKIDRKTYYEYLEKQGTLSLSYVSHILEATMNNPDYKEGWKIRLEATLKAQKNERS